jgi:hypothetical protein
MTEQTSDTPENGQPMNVTEEIDDLAAAKTLQTLAKASTEELPQPVNIALETKKDGSLGSKLVATKDPHVPDALSASIALASQLRQAQAAKRKGR